MIRRAIHQPRESSAMSSVWPRVPLITFLFAVLVVWTGEAHGQKFRVDSELFENQQKEPFLITLTIFRDGTVYDFRWTEPKEVTVLDTKNGRFTLIDEANRQKATVTTKELLEFSLELETHAAKEKDRLFAFCAAPQFEISQKPIEMNGQSLVELRLSSKLMTYVANGVKPQLEESGRAYRHFADWCARLNATRGGNLPPGARLALNKALAEGDLLPLEITRTTGGTLLEKKLELRSQHRVNWTLSGEDERQIERASDMMATFENVSYSDYLATAAKTPSKQARK